MRVFDGFGRHREGGRMRWMWQRSDRTMKMILCRFTRLTGLHGREFQIEGRFVDDILMAKWLL